MNQRQQNNTNAVVKLAAELGRGNGDPGGTDPFDGGCPSDTLPATVHPMPDNEPGKLFMVLRVRKDGRHDIGAFSYTDKAKAQAYANEINRDFGTIVHAYVASVSVPEFVEAKR